MKFTYLSILNSILIAAIAFVLIFKLNSNSAESDISQKPSESAVIEKPANPLPATTSSVANSTIDFSNLKIAFVNSDTVSTYYQFAKDVQASLLKKQSSAEKQIKNKYKEYERMVNEYQQSAKIMGQSEAQEKGQQIALLE